MINKASGYSGTPLYKKLGMKPHSKWKVIAPPRDYHELLGPFDQIDFSNEAADLDGIHVFSNQTEEIEKYMITLSRQIKKNGCIWFSWYKKSARLPTGITEDILRDTALSLGLVDVKVCSVDDHWSALKIVWRVENR
ncbi:MAG: DUF3052 domain-containing protein [Saprospiraceae bacterium]|nr:DUF3052 domain-containing protein [Saprospiraceae bacterium]